VRARLGDGAWRMHSAPHEYQRHALITKERLP